MKRKTSVFYLDLHKAYKENYVVDRNEWLSKYDIPGKPYKMMKGTEPLLCIDGTCIYLSEVTDLIVGGIMEKARYHRFVAGKKPVFFKWKR